MSRHAALPERIPSPRCATINRRTFAANEVGNYSLVNGSWAGLRWLPQPFKEKSMVSFRKSMILIHRYLGIVLSLLFVVWFVSGIGMIYSRAMPRLTPELRFERMPALDLSQVKLTPAEAAAHAGVEGAGRAVLLTVDERPAYRFGATTVFADTGETPGPVDEAKALTIAGRFMKLSADRVHYSRLVTEADQWTIGLRRQLPQHKVTVDDDARTELYIAPQSGDITMMTTRGSRTLAWIATIPHWLYFTSLRTNDALWRQVVLWTSGLGCILAIVGIIVGVIQLRRSPPHIPYTGWMRWHHITGLVFGILTLTWVFSGMLSMEPWGWASAEGLSIDPQAFSGGPLELSQFPALDAASWRSVVPAERLKEIEFIRIQGDPYYTARLSAEPGSTPVDARINQEYGIMGRAEPNTLLIGANPLQIRREPFSTESLMSRLTAEVPDARIIEQTMLSEYDSYYYSRDMAAPLPVLRVKFDDPGQTWVYLDPQRGRQVAQIHRLDRIERWIYNGFHSLDFAFWYYSPVWTWGVIFLSLGGIASSAIGVIVGFKRVLRGTRRTIKSLAARPVAQSRAGTSPEGP
jgi:hypothetical protein